MDDQITSHHLALLEERGLVRVFGEDMNRILRFGHALIREASYSTILTSRRAELHRDVAESIQELFPDRDALLSLILARHWLNAREYGQLARELLPRAQALISTGHGEALIELLTSIPPNQTSGSEELDLQIVLGDAYQATGAYDQARELYERILSRASDDVMKSRLLYHLGMVYYRLSRYERSIEFHHQSLVLTANTGDRWQEARTLKGLGLAYWNLSDYDNAQSVLERARDLIADTGDAIELANVELNLANVYRDRGAYPRAIEAGQHALALFEENRLPTLASYAHTALGSSYYSAGDLTTAISYYERAAQISRELNDPLGLAAGLCNLGELYEHLAQFEQSGASYREAIRLSQQLKNDYLLAFALTGLAEVRLHQARAGGEAAHLEAAQAGVEEALAVGLRMKSNERIGAAYRLRAEVHAARGQAEQAELDAQQAVELLQQVGHALELKRADRVYGEVLSTSARPQAHERAKFYLDQAEKGA